MIYAARRTGGRSICCSWTGGEIRAAKYLVELPPREMLGAKLGHRLSQPLLRHTFLTHAQIQHKNVFKPEISLLAIKDFKIDSSAFKWNF